MPGGKSDCIGEQSERIAAVRMNVEPVFKSHAVAGDPEGDKVASSAPSAAAGELRASEPASRTSHDETHPPREV